MILAKVGASILFYKNLPRDVPGFGGLEEKRKLLQQQLAQLNFKNEGNIKKAIVGKGAFYIGDKMEDLLAASKTRREIFGEKNLSFVRRKTNEGQTYFINNRSEKAVNDWVAVNTKAPSVALFDAMVGKNGLARWRTSANGIEVYLQLQPFESVIVQTYNSKKNR